MYTPSPFQSPTLRADLPVYPHVSELIRVTSATVTGPSGVAQFAGSSFLGPTLYVAYVQQVRSDSLLPRDRIPCLADDVNGLGLTPGFYQGRLMNSFNGLPTYAITDRAGTSGGGSLTVRDDKSHSFTPITDVEVHNATFTQTRGAGTADLKVDDASTVASGLVNTTAQEYAGVKTFEGQLIVNGTSGPVPFGESLVIDCQGMPIIGATAISITWSSGNASYFIPSGLDIQPSGAYCVGSLFSQSVANYNPSNGLVTMLVAPSVSGADTVTFYDTFPKIGNASTSPFLNERSFLRFDHDGITLGAGTGSLGLTGNAYQIEASPGTTLYRGITAFGGGGDAFIGGICISVATPALTGTFGS